MNIFLYLYTEFLWRPIFNGLIWLYNTAALQDLGLAIIIFTLIVRLVLMPLFGKAQKSQRELARIQPEMKKIQERLKGDREAQGKALMELYARHKVNPFSGCLSLLVQLPLLITIFQVFRTGFENENLAYLYSFIAHPGSLNPISLAILNLSEASIYLGVVAAVSQFFFTKLSMPTPNAAAQSSTDFAAIFQKQSLYIFPALILVWSYTLPSALTLYWTVFNIFGIVQEIVAGRRPPKTQNGPNPDTTGSSSPA